MKVFANKNFRYQVSASKCRLPKPTWEIFTLPYNKNGIGSVDVVIDNYAEETRIDLLYRVFPEIKLVYGK